MKTTLFLFLTTLLLITTSHARHPYYPNTFRHTVQTKNTRDQDLKNKIFELLTTLHQKNSSSPDTLGCDNDDNGKCYQQVSLGYRGAREILFGKLHLEEDAQGFFIRDVYCHKEFTSRQTNIGPRIIPNSDVLNCEHTWPQSKFSSRFPAGLQKSDLHHLFPTDSRANSIRGNYEFGELEHGDLLENNCDSSRTEGPGGRFEPPVEHRGNVARALFYFSVRYQINIGAKQEADLRKWHNEDPVDEDESNRNDQIYEVQFNRNPFIDYPELVGQIKDF